MKLKELIKMLFSRLVEIADRKISEMNQKEAQRVQALAEQNRKAIEDSRNVDLRKRWACALNSLPTHLHISSNDIDRYSLSNRYMQSYWELQVPVQELLSRSKCKGTQDQLAEILKNQFEEARQEFEQRIFNDSNEYTEQRRIVENGGTRTKEDSVFIGNYSKFANANYYRLVIVEIIDIECIDKLLHIQYKIDESVCLHFHGNNYWNLIVR